MGQSIREGESGWRGLASKLWTWWARQKRREAERLRWVRGGEVESGWCGLEAWIDGMDRRRGSVAWIKGVAQLGTSTE